MVSQIETKALFLSLPSFMHVLLDLFGVSKQNYGFPVEDVILKKVSSANENVNGYCLKCFDIDEYIKENHDKITKRGDRNDFNK